MRIRTLAAGLLARAGYAIRRMDHSGYVGVPPMSLKGMKRLLYFSRMLDLVRDVDGSVVECGVAAGDSLLMLLMLAHQEGRSRPIWGFDSFQGFPAPGPEDASRRKAKQGDFTNNRQNIHAMLSDAGMNASFIASNLTLVEGFFEHTLPAYAGPPIALLHVDADLYSSVLTVLKCLYPHVMPGGVVLFDDYINSERDWPGARQATDEFFGDLAGSIRHDEKADRYYLVKPAPVD